MEGRSTTTTPTPPKLQITQNFSIDSLIDISTIPSMWTALPLGQAYRLNVAREDNPPRIEKLIRSMGCWTTLTGGGDSKIVNVSHIMSGRVECRRIALQCGGVKLCSRLEGALNGYHSSGIDLVTKSLLDTRLLAQQTESTPLQRQTISFFHFIAEKKWTTCCAGQDTILLQQMRKGQPYAVLACKKWVDEQGHRCLESKREVDLEMLYDLLINGGCFPYVKDGCGLLLSPRVRLKFCPYVHSESEKLVRGIIIKRPCPTRLTIYSPQDVSIRVAIILVSNQHSHPFQPPC